MAERRPIVIDGSNVAFEEQSKGGKPKVANLIAIRDTLMKQGFDPIIIVDAALHHQIDDPKRLERMIDDGSVHQAPAGTDADFFVIKTAEQQQAPILSNDRYQPYQQDFPWIEQRRIPFMIVDGKIELYEPKLEEGAGQAP